MKDRSDDLSHHERTLLPQSYISLLIRTMFGRGWEEGVMAMLGLIFRYKHCSIKYQCFYNTNNGERVYAMFELFFWRKHRHSVAYIDTPHSLATCHPCNNHQHRPTIYSIVGHCLDQAPHFQLIIFSTALVFEETCILKMGYTLIWLSSCVTREVWTG